MWYWNVEQECGIAKIAEKIINKRMSDETIKILKMSGKNFEIAKMQPVRIEKRCKSALN